MFNPLFITPCYRYPGDVNSSMNSMLIDSLDKDEFSSIVLSSDSSAISSSNILKPKYSYTWRIILKIASIFHIPFYFEFTPDKFHWIWGKNATSAGIQYLKKNRIDYLHSISIPYSSHLVALKLKKKYKIPWIAHFYEPWSDNTYRRCTLLSASKNKEWEREVAKNADIIIHNSKQMCDSWLERYGAIVEDKLVYLPMPLNISSKIKGQNRDKSKIVISHIGNFYGLRNSGVFLHALKKCIEKDIIIKSKVEINFIGKTTDTDISLVNELQLNDIVNFVGLLSEEECVEYYRNSDVFLVIEGKDQGRLFFPSKIIKYFYYEKPIIGITEPGSVLDQLLSENKHCSYTHEDISGIANYIDKAVNSYSSLLSFKRNSWKEYEISNVISIYKSIVNKLCSRNIILL